MSPTVNEILLKLKPDEVRSLLTWLEKPLELKEYERNQDIQFALELYQRHYKSPYIVERLMARSNLSRSTAYRIIESALSQE